VLTITLVQSTTKSSCGLNHGGDYSRNLQVRRIDKDGDLSDQRPKQEPTDRVNDKRDSVRCGLRRGVVDTSIRPLKPRSLQKKGRRAPQKRKGGQGESGRLDDRKLHQRGLSL